ncbi:MAG: hypothetical protein JWO97_2502 [Acidobacteria bacterium]|nr:hypothetical protein [Acidobacteriota bacterium]
MQFRDDVQAALDAGELWRAKQRVGGRIGSSGRYDADLYEQYGVILLRMGDLVLAGKYLFLSGRRDEAYAEAIASFLRQHGRGGWRTMIGTFPNAARRLPLDQFPPPLRDELAQLGLPRETARTNPARRPHRTRFRDYLMLSGCVIVAMILFAIFSAGTRVFLHEIAQWLR